MTPSQLAFVVFVVAVALLSAASLHAMVAAFERLPWAQERFVAARRRPDGRPTTAARLAGLRDEIDNAASVAYATLEAVALVGWTGLAGALGRSLGWSWWIVAFVAVVVAAFLSLIVVRAVPRQLGRAHPLGTLHVVAPVAWALIVISAPLRRVVPALRAPALAEAEDLVEQAHGALEEEGVEMVRGVVNLGDTLTREVMVPRTDMVTIGSGTAVRKAMVLFMRSGFSRVPVVSGGVADTIGVLYLKDVVKATWDDESLLDAPVDELMRRPVFIPESVPVDDLLSRMQHEVFHMATVIDEYGGVAGLVTMEDALEEIVGELVDEHDRSEPDAEPLPDGAFRIPARFPLHRLGELFDLEVDEPDVETAAGLLAKSLGQVPIPGATASAHGVVLVADRVEGRRRRLTSLVVRRDETAPDVEEPVRTKTKRKDTGDA